MKKLARELVCFIEKFKMKRFSEALIALFPSPEIKMETIGNQNCFAEALLNFADSLYRFPPYYAYVAGSYLQKMIEDDIELFLEYEDFLNTLKKVNFFLQLSAAEQDDFSSIKLRDSIDENEALEHVYIPFEKGLKVCPKELTEKYLAMAPKGSYALIENRLSFTNHFVEFVRGKKKLSDALFIAGKPYVPFAFQGFGNIEIAAFQSNEIPLILMESCSIDWETILNKFKNLPKILLFYSKDVLLQALQFKEVLEAILEKETLVLVLNYYPLEQIQSSLFLENLPKAFSLKPLFISNDPYLKADIDFILGALTEYFRNHSSEPLNFLFELGKRHAFAREASRYGENRFLALWLRYAYEDWNDLHKQKPKKVSMHSKMPDYLKDIMEKTKTLEPKRKATPKKIKRIAHIINTVFDEAHAPAEILRSLLEHRNKTVFQARVYTTETGLYRPSEYPYYSFSGQDTLTRAKKTVQAFIADDVPLEVLSHPFLNYKEEANLLAEKLKESEIDIAIVHMPNPVNLLATKISEVPCKVFFDHGGYPMMRDNYGFCLPYYLGIPVDPKYDLIISCEERPKNEKLFYQKRGTQIEALPFSLDLRKNWSPKPVSRKELDPTGDHILLTTVSLNLFNRLSHDFIEAISEILTRCKTALYLPIGDPVYPEFFMSHFQKKGVANQVRFLGFQKNPSDFVRSMDIYLNEFPVGSGLALLEAMAAGLPIVTMYDEKDPMPASRMGGDYFGKDKAVTSMKKEDYVNLACRLIQEPKLYESWKKEALLAYEKRTDAKKYAKDFEALILKAYST